MSKPSALYHTVLSIFHDAGWAHNPIVEREVIRAGFEAHHTRVDLHLQVFPTLSAVSVVSESIQSCPSPAHRDRLAELAMRVNQTLTVGNFEVNWETSQLVFRVTNLFSTPQGDRKIIEGLIHTTVVEMDRIAPLETIIFQTQGPALAALNLTSLLEREDLLPQIGEPETQP